MNKTTKFDNPIWYSSTYVLGNVPKKDIFTNKKLSNYNDVLICKSMTLVKPNSMQDRCPLSVRLPLKVTWLPLSMRILVIKYLAPLSRKLPLQCLSF